MYLPAHFEESRLPVLHGLLRAAPLAALVLQGKSGLIANHVPMELSEQESGSPGVLRGHLAVANAAWSDHLPGTDALAIFQGPQGYVSPSWYPSKRESGKVVPTWSYIVAHAHGPIRWIRDRDWLLALVDRLTDVHESGRPAPWRLEDAPPDSLEKQLQAIVGFELEIRRLEGKWKLGQNRPAAARAAVAEHLPWTGGQTPFL